MWMHFPVELVLRNFRFPEFAYMVPLSSAVVSEVTIIRPAALSWCDLLSVQFSCQGTIATDSVHEQSYTSRLRTILVRPALVRCRGFSRFIILDTVNPDQGLYFPVAVPQCAPQTTCAVSGRVLAPLQNAW